jgi:hypothetical protein
MRCGARLASFHNCHCAHSHITALVSPTQPGSTTTNQRSLAHLGTLSPTHSITRSPLTRKRATQINAASHTLDHSLTCPDTRSRARRRSRMIRRAGQRIGSDWPGNSHRARRHHRHCLPGGQFIHGCQQRCNRRPHVSAINAIAATRPSNYTSAMHLSMVHGSSP